MLKHKVRELMVMGSIMGSGVALMAAPSGPVPVVPEGGQPPGAYPNTSVSSANWVARGGSAYDGNVDMNLAENGPIAWSISRYNRGDFALRLSPRDAAAARTNLNLGFTEVANATAAEAPGQAWAPHRARGILIPSVRQNGPITWPDGEGAFFPTIATSTGSSGNGYDMVTGAFDTGDSDINTGKAGAAGEGNFNFATTWFPYDQGWLGGEIAGPGPEGQSSWTSSDAHAAGLAAGSVKWLEIGGEGSGTYGGLAELRLPGVNSLNDGMLFTTSTDGASDVNIVGVTPLASGAGWLITVREDSATDAETLATPDTSEFEFVYIPATAPGLIGGHVNGTTGAKIKAVGDFTVARTGTGTYELTIPGKTGSTGTLLLQVADLESGTSVPMASRAFLSYEYTNNRFVIQSRKTTGDNAADLADAGFYVAYIDFAQPLTAPAGPRLRTPGRVVVSGAEEVAKETSLAASSDSPEVLVVYIDSVNAAGNLDPITQQPAVNMVMGRFHNAKTLAPIADAFPIFGNPIAAMAKLDVKYNPVSRQYVVASLARTYNASSVDTVLMALINPSSIAGANSPVAKTIVHDPNTTESYDDVSVAVSTNNGNFILVAEHKFSGEGEGTVAALYSPSGTLLTPPATRVDLLQQVGDEDDPDVTYLPGRNAFLYIANTDNSNGSTGTLANRVVGSIINEAPNAQGALVVRPEQPLGNGEPAGRAEAHPSALLNPFNGQLLTVYDSGNGTSAGDLSYTDLGTAPNYTFTAAQPEIPYLAGPAAGDPFQHQHPQLAVDQNSGVILLGMNAASSTVGLPDGYAFILLGPDGKPLTGQPSLPYYLADAPGRIDHGVNYHTLRYSPAADQFVVAFSTIPGVAYLTALEITSNHATGGVDAPQLSISRSGNNATIRWVGTGFELQATSSLNPANWQNAGVTPVPDGAGFRAEVPLSGSARFFRLRHP